MTKRARLFSVVTDVTRHRLRRVRVVPSSTAPSVWFRHRYYYYSLMHPLRAPVTNFTPLTDAQLAIPLLTDAKLVIPLLVISLQSSPVIDSWYSASVLTRIGGGGE